MSDTDRELLDRIDRFLDKFGDTQSPICMDCLTEFSAGVERCSDCHGRLVAGPIGVAELRVHLARQRESARIGAWREHDQTRRASERTVADHAQPQPVEEEGPPLPNEGDACPRCGTPFDPDVDVEGCENCRQLALQESEKMAADVDPDPAEQAAVERFKRFLAQETDPDYTYCPGCLNEFTPSTAACVKCTKELLPADDARTFARRTVEDLTAHWFAPVMDDADADFVDRVLAALDADEQAPRVELRVKSVYRDFSPIFAVWRSYRTLYYARRSELPALLRWLVAAELGPDHVVQYNALVEHLERMVSFKV